MFTEGKDTPDTGRNVNRVKVLREMITRNSLAFACQAERMEREHAELIEALQLAVTYYVGAGRTSQTVAGDAGRVADKIRALLVKLDGTPSDATQLTAAFNARDTVQLRGREMRVKASDELPHYFAGMRVKVLRQSERRANALVVEALEKRGPYNVGDEIHTNQSDLEPVT